MVALPATRNAWTLTTFSGFEQLPPAYARLFAPASRRDVFATLPWFLNFEKHALHPGEQVRIYAVGRDADSPLAALAMRAAERPRNWLQARELRSLTNFYTSRFAPACACTGVERIEALAALAGAIGHDSPVWDMVNLRPLDASSELFQETAKAFQRAGMPVHPYFCFGNWYLPVAGRSFEEYLNSLPAKARNTLQRKSRKLEKSGIGRVEIIRDSNGLEAAIADYQQVYSASWKVPEPYPQFIPGLIRTCAQTGELRLGMVYINGQPAAVQFWIVHGGTASIYKLAYDQRFAEHSVGTILTARMMEYVLDVDRVSEVDYLSGDDPYKKDWMSHRRELWGLMAFNPSTLRGQQNMVRHMGARAAKNFFHWLFRRPAQAPVAAKTSDRGLWQWTS